ncbi:hypothetical protein E20_20 [Escherichia phage E20]|nr:hypothetical protein E20_20 [Escherichia phage E20]WBF79726.1 hypothetical protein F22_0020 [Escherichia phage vB_Eco_F22]
MSKLLKLWLISQSENRGHDSFDSAVVAAYTEEEAKQINPDGEWKLYTAWCSSPDKVHVEYLGIATEGVEPGIVLSSFNAG